MLQAEGLVVAIPNRGAMVRVHTTDDLDDLYQLRALLEGYAARRAATRISEEELEQLRASCDRFESLDPDEELRELVRENLFFHSSILDAAGSARLASMVRRVIELPLVYKSYIWYSPDQKRISAHYHRQIVNALAARDAERAELIMKEHVFEARDLLVSHLRANPQERGGRSRRVSSSAATGEATDRRDRRPRAARRRPGDRAGNAPRRPVRRPAARRHGRRGDQDRAAGQARSAARLGQGALRGPLAVVARPVEEQEVLHAQPARPRRARSCCSSSSSTATCSSRTSGRARSSAGTSAPTGSGRRTQARDRPHLGLRPDRAVRRAGRLRVGRRGDGRDPLHQRLPGRAAAAHPHLARRLARRRCSRRRASSPPSTGATRSAAGAARSSTSR